MMKQFLRIAATSAALTVSIAAAAGAQVYLSTTDHTIGNLAPIGFFTVAATGSYGFSCAAGHSFCAYNGNGDPTTGLAAPGTSSFVFNSGVFAAKGFGLAAAPTSITFIGSDGVSTFTSTPCTLSATIFTFCANTFTNSITSLTFKTAGGTSYTADAQGGYFLANDLTFNAQAGPSSTVPEPGETALLGTGLIGLVPIVRRKLKK